MHAKRRALDYWVQNKGMLGLSLNEFFQRCRLSPDERTITFLKSSQAA